MKKYSNIFIEILEQDSMDVICTSGGSSSGQLAAGEFDNEDVWGY